MPKKQHYKWHFKCSNSKCRKKGVAKFEEYENPVNSRGKLATTLKSLSKGFTPERNNEGIFIFRCKKCDAVTKT